MKTLEMVRTTYRVSDFVSWKRAGTLELSPSFQRRPVWKPGAKSFLVDTTVRGLPMPVIMLREHKTNLNKLEPSREVVDGQQRLRTLFTYIDSSLLKDYKRDTDAFEIEPDHNSDLAGKTFSQLSNDLKQRILDYQFSVQILPTGIDDREVLQIFARLNATGIKLNFQELRNAEFYGKFKTSMYALAAEQLPRWRNWKIFTEYNIARMEEVEITGEFAMLMFKGVTGKSQTAIDTIYKQKDDEKFPEKFEVEHRFRSVMDTIEDKFGDELLAFKKKTLFYSLFAFIYDMEFGIGSELKKLHKKNVPSNAITWVKAAAEKIQSGSAPKEVLDAVARRTTNPDSRKKVLEYLKKGK
jgi:hypothetical protein